MKVPTPPSHTHKHTPPSPVDNPYLPWFRLPLPLMTAAYIFPATEARLDQTHVWEEFEEFVGKQMLYLDFNYLHLQHTRRFQGKMCFK